MRRVFLGWDAPALPRVAAWLRAEYGRGDPCDLSAVTVVLPGGRAGRRLLELLVTGAQGPGRAAICPPRIITLGELPELLYQVEEPVADDLQSALAWVAALRRLPTAVLGQVVAQPPEPDDLAGWLALAEDFSGLQQELAAEGLAIAEVAARAADLPDFGEQERWQTLADAAAAWAGALAAAGLADRHQTRRRALENRACRAPGPIVLLATDFSGVMRRMLEAVEDSVTTLIFAPEALADRFDECGRLVVPRWCDQPLDTLPRDLRVVDRPSDQARQVVAAIADAQASLGPACGPDQITVGVGDEAHLPVVQRILELAGWAVRPATGRALLQTRPALLLAALAEFLSSRRFSDFAALIRHPDLVPLPTRDEAAASPDDQPPQPDLAGLLDRYLTEHLQPMVNGRWLGPDDIRRPLARAVEALDGLLPPDRARPRPLPEWCPAVAAFLDGVYGRRPLQRDQEEDDQLIQALQAIGDALRRIGELDPRSPLTPRTSLAQALGVVLRQLAGRNLASRGGQPAVELLGWLELSLDDAPALVVTDFNEGLVPQAVNADAFLPDRLRTALGLVDNRRRYARDAYFLSAMLHSRPVVSLIACRRGSDQEPRVPSRLLLARPAAELPALLARFYPEAAADEPPPPPLLAGAPDDRSGFIVPVPAPAADQPLDRLRVTAFRDYLACPYRFYLRHVRKLEAADDQAVEMDGMRFGNLAHRVFQRFARGPSAAETDPERVARALDRELDAVARDCFGDPCPAAVLIQCEQLRYRLRALAPLQAQWNREGWRILPELTEKEMQAVWQVDGRPFTITGRIDRIDQHPELGHRILDYKTGDRAHTPEEQHRAGPRGAREWIDLQLPLYRRLCAAEKIVDQAALGYLLLPKDLTKVGLAVAAWTQDELTAAEDKAVEVIRAVRAGVFWPPTYPADTGAEFAGICQDDSLDRAEALRPGDAWARGRNVTPHRA